MKTLTVKREGTSTEFSYEIVWDGSYERLAGCVENLKLPAKKACIVTDSTVSELYLEEVKNVLSPLFETVTAFVFPAGEASKNLDTVKDLYTHLIENHFERKDILFALGGGVVGDLTGYAAATYLRGIDFIQLPTTLLAQVDSSVGGKTGVDFDQYKNMVGAFHHPRLVYMNMATLKSLNGEQFACGMGEVLKTGLIRDEKFYIWTINHMSEIEERIEPVLTKMIQKCCDIKRQVVENDPTEGISSPKIEKRVPSVLTSSEVALLLDQPKNVDLKGTRDKAMLEFAYATGMRVTEIISLDIDDIDFKEGFVNCRKANKQRIIPLGKMSLKALKEYTDHAREILLKDDNEKALFVNVNGQRLTRQGFWKIIKYYKEQAHISKDITPHVLRHSFATLCSTLGMPPEVLHVIIGHADFDTTRKYYIHITEAKKKNEMLKLYR